MAGDANARGGFGTGEIERGDVDGLPFFGGGERRRGELQLDVVDGVGLIEAEACGGKGDAAACWRPVEAAFVRPARFGFERRVAAGCGVGVVEVNVAGLAKSMTHS